MKKKMKKKILLNNKFVDFIYFPHSQYFLNTGCDCIGLDNINNNYLQKYKLGRLIFKKNQIIQNRNK